MYLFYLIMYVYFFLKKLVSVTTDFLHFNRYRSKDIAMIVITKSLCGCNGFE